MTEKVGLLLLSHGARAQDANDELVAMAAGLQIGMPVVKAFMENAPERTIARGVAALEAEGAETIVVVPLYFPSNDGHMQEVRYELGLTEEAPTGGHRAVERVNTRARILLAPSFGAHPSIVQILIDRALEVSEDPTGESLVLVHHGSGEESREPGEWEAICGALIQQIQERVPFRRVMGATIHPETVRQSVTTLAEEGRVLVTSLFITRNMFTTKMIPGLVEGLPARFNSRPLLPDSRMEGYITFRVSQALSTKENV